MLLYSNRLSQLALNGLLTKHFCPKSISLVYPFAINRFGKAMDMGNKTAARTIAEIAEHGRATPYDVMYLRGDLFRDDVIETDDVERLLELDGQLQEKCKEWGWLVCEAVVQHVVDEGTTGGVVSVEKAHWLIGQITENGVVESAELFEALAEVVETARSVPDALVSVALVEVKRAVTENKGPAATGRQGDSKVIRKSDVDLLCRVLYGFGGEKGIAVSRLEAEFLFDLNDATAEYDNDPAWSNLFVKAVGCYLLATAQGDGAPSGATVEPGGDEGWELLWRFGELMRTEKDGPGCDGAKPGGGFAVRNGKMQSQLRAAEVVTASESDWVAKRMGRDGKLHKNETALLRFVGEQSRAIHPDLEPLMAQSA